MRRSVSLWLSLALACSACSSREERGEQAREQARDAIARGSRNEALAALAELRANQPDTPRAIEEYAALLVAAGGAPEAVWVLEDAVRRFDDQPLKLALAGVLLIVSDAARARDIAAKVPADAPEHARALILRARAELELGDLDTALATFREVERTYPDQPGVRLPRIATLLEQRRFDEARNAILDARKASSDSADVSALRHLEANLYLQQARSGDLAAATAGVQRLVDEAPDDAALWAALVPLLFADRKHEHARDLVAAALAADPDRFALYGIAASIEHALGRREQAEASLRAWIERAPSPTGYSALARLQSEYGDDATALATLERGIAEFPSDRMLPVARVETLLGAERVGDAEAAIAPLASGAIDPRHLELLRARIDLARGDARAARSRLERLVPELDDATSQFWLGRALEQTGDPIGAERRYAISITRNPVDPSGALAASQLAAARGDWAVAGSYAQLAVQRSPGLGGAWQSLVTALIEFGRGDEAERVARQALELFPSDANIHALHAAALRTQGRYADALAAVDRGREHDAGSVSIAAERALSLALSGDVERGIEEARAGVERSPDAAELHYALALLLYHAGRAEPGDVEIERALALAPDDLRPLRRRLEYRAANGRWAPARADAERYLARRPADAHAHFVLGVVEDRSGRVDAALTAYRRAAELDPNAHAPLNNLADLLDRQNRLDEALDAAQQAYRRANRDPYVLDTLGWLYLRSGKVDRSISLLEEAHAAAPALPEAKLHLALAYREAGRAGEARELLVALRASAPDPLRAEVDKALATLQ